MMGPAAEEASISYNRPFVPYLVVQPEG